MTPLNLNLEVRGRGVRDLKYEKNARHYCRIEDEGDLVAENVGRESVINP